MYINYSVELVCILLISIEMVIKPTSDYGCTGGVEYIDAQYVPPEVILAPKVRKG